MPERVYAMNNGAKPRIVVLGGGFAGLESSFYLRMRLKDRADITLVSDQDHFLFKPNTIYIPFGLDPEKLKIPLEQPTRRKDIRLVQAHARGIDADTKAVHAKPFASVSMWVMEQYDKATFAQVQLRLTGSPELPVESNRRRWISTESGRPARGVWGRSCWACTCPGASVRAIPSMSACHGRVWRLG